MQYMWNENSWLQNLCLRLIDLIITSSQLEGAMDSVGKGILNGTSMRLQYLGQCPTTDFVAWNHVGTNHLDDMEIQEESIPEAFTNTITRLTYWGIL